MDVSYIKHTSENKRIIIPHKNHHLTMAYKTINIGHHNIDEQVKTINHIVTIINHIVTKHHDHKTIYMIIDNQSQVNSSHTLLNKTRW